MCVCFLCGRFARTCRSVCETSRAHETKARLRFANHKTAHKLRVCVYCFGVCTNKLGAHGSHAHAHALFAHDVNALPMLRSQVCIVCGCAPVLRVLGDNKTPPHHHNQHLLNNILACQHARAIAKNQCVICGR